MELTPLPCADAVCITSFFFDQVVTKINVKRRWREQSHVGGVVQWALDIGDSAVIDNVPHDLLQQVVEALPLVLLDFAPVKASAVELFVLMGTVDALVNSIQSLRRPQ